jgi:protein SCO1
MPNRSNPLILGSREALVALASIFAAIIFLSAGCNSKPAAQANRFHLHGKIVSLDVSTGSAEIDHDAIPGYMDAMTMPYAIPDKKVLSTLSRGDEITADVLVVDGVPHLENVVVLRHAAKQDPASSSSFHAPQTGETVPDFALLDQNGRRIHLSSYRGDTLLLTFIYTRCPFADFCPKVSAYFAQIYAALRKTKAATATIRLLSVSFDPKHDTPAVLRQYAASFRHITATDRPFDRWEFAAAPADELPKVAKFFGVYYNAQSGQIIHSMSTSLVSPEGKIVVWFHDNDWNPQDLLAQAVQTVRSPEPLNAKNAAAGTFQPPK